MAQLPLLMAMGTGLQLLPCWDSPSCKTPAMIEACGCILAQSLSQHLSFARFQLPATSGKSSQQNLRQTFRASKNLTL